MLVVPGENASTATMRRYRQILQTHLAMSECVSYIELIGIEDLDQESEVSLKNDDGIMVTRIMSVRSVLMDIKVPGTEHQLFLVITVNHYGDCKGVLSTVREQEAEAEKVALHVVSSVMYRMMFKIMVDSSYIA